MVNGQQLWINTEWNEKLFSFLLPEAINLKNHPARGGSSLLHGARAEIPLPRHSEFKLGQVELA